MDMMQRSMASIAKTKVSKMVQQIKFFFSWVFNLQEEKKLFNFQLIKWICARIEPFRVTTEFIHKQNTLSVVSFRFVGSNKNRMTVRDRMFARGLQNLNIASSRTVTVYSYLNTTLNMQLINSLFLAFSQQQPFFIAIQPQTHSFFFIKSLENLR